MKIHANDDGEVATLTLKGEFDTFCCPDFQDTVERTLAAGRARVVVDMSELKFINSTAMRAVIQAREKCAERGGALVIGCPESFVRTCIAKMGGDQVVPVADDAATARKQVGRSVEGEAGSKRTK